MFKLLKKETKAHSFLRYVLLLALVIIYAIYVTHKLGTKDGIIVTIITWSFFVFCTPIADAGFFIAFPTRLLLGIRMVYTQIFSYVFAFIINVIFLITFPAIYNKTLILKLFHTIITTPYPDWLIIVISFIGTFFSIYFGDELMDVDRHKERVKYHKHMNKYKFVIFLFIIIATIILYNFLLQQININIPL